MSYKIKVFSGWVLAVLTILFFVSCNISKSEAYDDVDEISEQSVLESIRSKNKLIVVTGYNSLDYFIYKGNPMGYQLEMAEAFAREIGVQLEIIIESNPQKAIRLLEEKKADIIAMDLPLTLEYSRRLEYATPFAQTRLVLVQQKANTTASSHLSENGPYEFITNPLQLGGKVIYLPDNDFLSGRLLRLMEEIGDTIEIVRMPELSSEELIAKVASGEIQYTIAEERLALVNAGIYQSIDVKTPVSFEYHVSWAVRKGALGIQGLIDRWFSLYSASRDASLVYGKYYRNPRLSKVSGISHFSGNDLKISDYDELLKGLGRAIGWDWRLLASLIYQESGFRNDRTSWAGAFGIMQLMPATAEIYGIDSLSAPSQQIVAGVRYIQWLENQWKDIITDPEERRKFVMASYNVGLGHVFDARRLAEKYGRNPNKWQDSVEFFLEAKSSPEYYTDDSVYYGYCMGDQPVKYVNEIIHRYGHYTNFYR